MSDESQINRRPSDRAHAGQARKFEDAFERTGIRPRLLCCTPTAHWLEYADWWNPVLAEPLVSDSIGSGVEWNENALQRFVV
jgi:hypothetical protein